MYLYLIPDPTGVLGVRLWQVGARSQEPAFPGSHIHQQSLANMANDELQAHDTYYVDGRMVVMSVSTPSWTPVHIVDFFQCGGKLFKIPHWHLRKYCPILLHLAELDTDGTRGSSDDTAIPIDDHTSVEEFVIFLDFFYRGFVPDRHVQRFLWLTVSLSILRKEIPTDEWCKLLVISSKLDCEEMRVRAIDELTAKKTNVSPVDRIELGNKYNVPQWLPEAYADAFIRESHLTTEEGEKLGLEIAVKVLQGRDRCKRNGWNSSGDSNVTQLVKEIFPPPRLQKKNAGSNRRRAGRS